MPKIKDRHVEIRIDGVPGALRLAALPFGRKIEHMCAIKRFRDSARTVCIDMKRRTFGKAFAEFKRLYQPTQWYAEAADGAGVRDDSFQVWFTSDVPETRPRFHWRGTAMNGSTFIGECTLSPDLLPCYVAGWKAAHEGRELSAVIDGLTPDGAAAGTAGYSDRRDYVDAIILSEER